MIRFATFRKTGEWVNNGKLQGFREKHLKCGQKMSSSVFDKMTYKRGPDYNRYLTSVARIRTDFPTLSYRTAEGFHNRILLNIKQNSKFNIRKNNYSVDRRALVKIDNITAKNRQKVLRV